MECYVQYIQSALLLVQVVYITLQDAQTRTKLIAGIYSRQYQVNTITLSRLHKSKLVELIQNQEYSNP